MSLDEFSLIEKYLRPLAVSDAAKGLKNDGAVIPFEPSHTQIVTMDTLIEGVHFTSDMSADKIAQKLLRVNVSDIVAMGAKASFYTLAFSFSSGRDVEWYDLFFKGLADDQALYNLSLLGGDTTMHDGPLVLTCTMMGSLEPGQTMLSRQGAQGGDGIYVTGTIGDAALGVRLVTGEAQWELSDEHRDFLIGRYALPQPRCLHAKTISSFAHSGLDVSDGLLQDIGHLTMAYGLGAEIAREAIPLSAAAQSVVEQDEEAWQFILGGGDDYEIAFTSSEHNHQELILMGNMSEVPICRIGEVKGNAIIVLDGKGELVPLNQLGFVHKD